MILKFYILYGLSGLNFSKNCIRAAGSCYSVSSDRSKFHQSELKKIWFGLVWFGFRLVWFQTKLLKFLVLQLFRLIFWFKLNKIL